MSRENCVPCGGVEHSEEFHDYDCCQLCAKMDHFTSDCSLYPRCGVENPHYPGEYRCSWPKGHIPRQPPTDIYKPNADRFDHGCPEVGAYWNMEPMPKPEPVQLVQYTPPVFVPATKMVYKFNMKRGAWSTYYNGRKTWTGEHMTDMSIIADDQPAAVELARKLSGDAFAGGTWHFKVISIEPVEIPNGTA